MKIIFENSTKTSINDLLSFIHLLNDNNVSMDGGNCGTFTLALAELYNSPCEILMITNADDEEELINGEPNIYHVAIRINDVIIDCTGITTIKQMVDIAEDQYGDYDSEIFIFTYPQEKRKIISAIINNTDYSINPKAYVKFFKENN